MKIQEMFLTPSKFTRPQTKIIPTALAWHYVANPGTSALANRNYFESLKDLKKTYASSHFIVGLKGEILQLIPENEKSLCTNNANDYTISIECCHPDESGKFLEPTYNSMIWLGRHLMKKHNIKENIRHYDVTGKICPKWFVDNENEWKIFKNKLKGEIMLDEIIKELGITEDDLKKALLELISHKINKEKRANWLSNELFQNIKSTGISDMSRLNDLATRAEVATMVYNSIKKVD